MDLNHVVLIATWMVIGGTIGLAVNRVIYQLPLDRSPRSTPQCWTCSAPIANLGRPGRDACPNCGWPLQFDRLEWLTATVFGALALAHGFSGELLVYSLYVTILVVIAAIDARYRYVYTIVSYPAIVLAVLLSSTLSGASFLTPLVGLLIGGGTFLTFYIVGRLLYHGVEPMGIGDVTIAALIGAMVGAPRVVAALLVGASVSAAIGLVVVLTRRGGRRTYVPFGPGLCAGAILAFFIAP